MKHIHLIMVISFTVFFSGCIKDGLPECRFLNYLTFEYTKNKQGTDLFPSQVKRLDIYVFDSNGKYIRHISDEGLHLSLPSYTLPVDLPSGKYTFVVWGGIKKDYQVFDKSGNNEQPLQPDISFLDHSRLSLNTNKVNKDFPEDLYFGIAKEISVNPNELKQTHIKLIKNTNTIYITVNGLQNIKHSNNNADLDIICNITNGELKFDNSISLPERLFQYIPVERTGTEETLMFKIKTLRLLTDMKSELILKDLTSGEIIFNHNLVELLLLSPGINNNEDLDTNDEYDISISININLCITITINDFIVLESDREV